MNRRQFCKTAGLFGLTALAPAPVWAMGDQDRFTVALLKYEGANWNPRPSALRRLMLEVEKRTSVEVRPDSPVVDGTSQDIFEYPFLVLAGDRRFDPLPDEMIRNLRTHLRAGGFLFVDSSEGVVDGPFARCVARELKRVFPRNELANIPRDHVIHKSFYLINEPVGRIAAAKNTQGIFLDDRVAVVVSHNDVLGALARDNFGNWEYSVTPGGDRQREMAYRLGVNLVMYSLTINYKSDQVHVPFILRRRRWRVD